MREVEWNFKDAREQLERLAEGLEEIKRGQGRWCCAKPLVACPTCGTIYGVALMVSLVLYLHLGVGGGYVCVSF